MIHRSKLIAVLLAMVSLFVAAIPVMAATQSQADPRPTAVFGDVTVVTDAFLEVATKNGNVTFPINEETVYRSSDAAGEAPTIEVGDKIAALVESGVAQTIMVVTKRDPAKSQRVVHVTGIVTNDPNQGTLLVTEDGRSILISFGLDAEAPEAGTVVTVIGRLDGDVLNVKSVQPISVTLARLNDHLDELGEGSSSQEQRIKQVTRAQRLLQDNSARQVKLLSEASDRLPEEARKGLAIALEQVEQANQAANRAFETAIRIAGEAEQEERNVDRINARRLPKAVAPSLADVAVVLGITEDELITRLKDGTPLADIVTALGFTPVQLYDGVANRVRDRLEQLVESGSIEADIARQVFTEVREDMAERIRELFTTARPHIDIPFSAEDIAAILGMEPETFFALVRDGASVLEVAESQGISKEELLEEFEALAKRRAEALIADGAIDAADAERFLAAMNKKLRDLIVESRKQSDRDEDNSGQGRTIRPSDIKIPFDLRVLANALDIESLDELRELLATGVTIAEIAEARNRSIEAITDELLEDLRSKLAETVASGRLTAEEAAKLLEQSRSNFIDRLREFHVQATDEDRPVRPTTPPGQNRPYSGVHLTFEEIADVLDVTPAGLRKWMTEREGVAGLLRERGLSVEDLVAKLLGLVEQRLRADAASPDVSEEKVQSILASLKRRLTADLSGTNRGRVEAEARPATAQVREVRASQLVPFDIEIVARVLGITPEELKKPLAEGLTVAAIAERLNVPLDQIVAALLTPLEERIQKALEDGADPAQVRAKLQELRRSILRALRNFHLPSEEDQRQAKERQERGTDAAEERKVKAEEAQKRAVEEREQQVKKRQERVREEAEQRTTQRQSDGEKRAAELLEEQLNRRAEARAEAEKRAAEGTNGTPGDSTSENTTAGGSTTDDRTKETPTPTPTPTTAVRSVS
ncbi:MAG: hypothetical protein O2812_00400 [Chloroflexi bacterium]|nr:hypothetical protein [Chloroflexota bacterium]